MGGGYTYTPEKPNLVHEVHKYHAATVVPLAAIFEEKKVPKMCQPKQKTPQNPGLMGKFEEAGEWFSRSPIKSN